jgi:hypothetical protein
MIGNATISVVLPERTQAQTAVEILPKVCLQTPYTKSLRAKRSNLCLKKRLLRRLRLLAMTLALWFSDTFTVVS